MSSLLVRAVAVVICLCAPVFASDAYRSEVKVTTLLKTGTDSAGCPLAYPKEGKPEVTGVLVEIPVGATTGWHIHEAPCFAYILEGEVTVELEDGTRKVIRAGEAFSEVVNRRHNGSNQGKIPVKLVLFAVSTEGVPVATKVP